MFATVTPVGTKQIGTSLKPQFSRAPKTTIVLTNHPSPTDPSLPKGGKKGKNSKRKHKTHSPIAEGEEMEIEKPPSSKKSKGSKKKDKGKKSKKPPESESDGDEPLQPHQMPRVPLPPNPLSKPGRMAPSFVRPVLFEDQQNEFLAVMDEVNIDEFLTDPLKAGKALKKFESYSILGGRGPTIKGETFQAKRGCENSSYS